MILNYEDRDLSFGYKYKVGTLLGWERVHGLRFQNSDGKRFNPWLEKPVRLMIRGKTEDGRTGTGIKK
jgi:hypothetical protein